MIQQLLKQKEFHHEDLSSRIYGVVPALVTNNKDPDNLGRVKVKYPWMGEAKDKESHWARIVTFMAGKDRGGYFLPEVDDEVLVAFENGDINYPYIIGTLWNGVDKPIEKNSDGKNNVKLIQTRSGHKIKLDDTKDKEKITIEDKSGKRILTFDTEKKVISLENTDDKGEIKIKSKGKMSLESEDELSIKAKKKISIKTDDDISLDGKNVNVKSSANTAIKSSGKFEAKASAAASISSNAQLGLKGNSGAKLEAGGTVDVKGNGPVTVQSSAITTVKGSMVKVN